MKYKKSKYNIIANNPQSKSDNVILYNTWQCKFITLTSEQYEFLQSKELFEKDEFPQQLIKDRFAVSEMIDETATFLAKERKYRETRSNFFTITICTTMVCNMRCVYCFEQGVEQHSMTIQTEEKILEYVKRESLENDYKSLGVTWFGGEPLCNFDAIQRMSKELITFTKEHRIKYVSYMITNGLLLTESTSKVLYDECNVKLLQVTIDGFAKTYAKQKGVSEDVFERVINNIKSAHQKVRIRLNANRENVEELLQLAKYLKENISNLDYIYMSSLKASVEKDKEKLLTEKEYISAKIRLNEICGVDNSNVKYEPKERHVCTLCTINSVFIAEDGYLYTCNDDVGKKERSIGTVEYGINKSSCRYKEFRSEFDVDEVCKSCAYLPYCKGGCRFEYLSKAKVRKCEEYKYLLHKSIENYLQQLQ